MDHDFNAGAACPASDLTARLEGELARARQQLSAAESRYAQAVDRALATGEPIPFAPRKALVSSRRDFTALVRFRAGLPTAGGCHVDIA